MEQFVNDLYVFLLNFAKEYIFYIVIILFMIMFVLNYKFKNRRRDRLDSQVLNVEDSLICLHDDNCKRILKLEKQVKALENLLHDKELEIKKLEKDVNSLK